MICFTCINNLRQDKMTLSPEILLEYTSTPSNSVNLKNPCVICNNITTPSNIEGWRQSYNALQIKALNNKPKQHELINKTTQKQIVHENALSIQKLKNLVVKNGRYSPIPRIILTMGAHTVKEEEKRIGDDQYATYLDKKLRDLSKIKVNVKGKTKQIIEYRGWIKPPFPNSKWGGIL